MKVLFLTQYNYSKDGAMFGGSSNIRYLKTYLEKNGHEVIIYTPKDVMTTSDTHGGFLNIFRKGIASIKLIRESWKEIQAMKPDIIIVKPSLTAYVILHMNFSKIPIVYYAEDLILQLSKARWDNHFRRWMFNFFERGLISRSQKVFATGQQMKDWLVWAGWANSDKISIVPYGTDMEMFNTNAQEYAHPATKDKVSFLFVGGMGTRQNLSGFALRMQDSINRSDIEFNFIGKTLDKNTDRMFSVSKTYKKPINHLGIVNYNEIPGQIHRHDFGIVILDNDSCLDYCMPSKLAEYLACGKPILAYGPEEGSSYGGKKHGVAVREFINKHKVGVYILTKKPHTEEQSPQVELERIINIANRNNREFVPVTLQAVSNQIEQQIDTAIASPPLLTEAYDTNIAIDHLIFNYDRYRENCFEAAKLFDSDISAKIFMEECLKIVKK